MDKWYEDPVYIKMCEKAEEVQAISVEIAKRKFLRTSAVGLLVNAIDYSGEVFIFYGENHIWLPRQDQLQKLLELWRYCSNEVSSLAWGVWNFYTHIENDWHPDSMEQLWLAFVMFELHQKKWYNGEWIKSG